MALQAHGHEDLITFAGELERLAGEVRKVAAELKKIKGDELEVDHELKRLAAINNVEDWLADADKKLRLMRTQMKFGVHERKGR